MLNVFSVNKHTEKSSSIKLLILFTISLFLGSLSGDKTTFSFLSILKSEQ